MKAKTIITIKAFALSWILALAACGGSGGNGGAAPAPPAPSALGLWIGSTSTSRSVTGIVLDDGTYVGPASVKGGDELTTIVVSSPGVVAGTGIEIGTGTVGCRFVGTAVPRAKGNLYDLSVVVSGVGACASGPSSIKGIGYFDASAKRLYIAALNNSRSDGLIFVGIKS